MIRARLACIKHLSFAIIALVFILCAVEVGLRIYMANHAGQLPDDDPGNSLVVRSWQTHHGLKPLGTATCRNPDTGAAIEITTNSYALRGTEPEVPKPVGVFRVLCLGDESTLGADVELAETFCRQIEVLLQPHSRPKIEVINAGVPGYCPLLSYLQVKHSLLALQPDLILLNFDMGDIAEDYRYRRHTHIDPGGELLACPNPSFVKQAAARHSGITDQFLLARWGISQLTEMPVAEKRPDDLHRIDSSLARYAWLQDNPPDWKIHIAQALTPIERLKHLSDRNSIRLAIAVYPAPWQVAATATRGGNVRQSLGVGPDTLFRSRLPFDTLQQYSQEKLISYHDASPAFLTAEHPEQLFLNNAARFSAAGHKLYARELARFIYGTIPDIWNAPASSPDSTPPIRHARADGR